jgi:uncharacterized RDD family membrane protein YckC
MTNSPPTAPPNRSVDEQILTGEAVALDLGAASFLSRLLGGLIDLLATALVVWLIAWISAKFLFPSNLAAKRAGFVVLFVLLTLGIPTLVEGLSHGLSLGKLVAGYRIVRDDGAPPTGRAAFTRALIGLAEIWLSLGGLAVVTMLFNNRSKRLGDYLAGTRAVRQRGQFAPPKPIIMPAELANWAARADIGQVDDVLALRARILLTRWQQLSPASQVHHSLFLAEQIGQVVAPAPPPGTDPMHYLAAVLAERRNRQIAQDKITAPTSQQISAATKRLGYGFDEAV